MVSHQKHKRIVICIGTPPGIAFRGIGVERQSLLSLGLR